MQPDPNRDQSLAEYAPGPTGEAPKAEFSTEPTPAPHRFWDTDLGFWLHWTLLFVGLALVLFVIALVLSLDWRDVLPQWGYVVEHHRTGRLP